MLGTRLLPEAPLDDLSKFGFKGCEAGVEQFTLGYDHEVEARGELVPSENLSNQSLGSVPFDRAPEFLRRRDSEPPQRARVRKEEQRGVAAVHLGALFVDLQELGAPTDVLGVYEPRATRHSQ